MPTPRPEPVQPARDTEERIARAKAVGFIDELMTAFHDSSYATRSHMPGESGDWTIFTEGLEKLRSYAAARPDWTLAVLRRVLTEEAQYRVL